MNAADVQAPASLVAESAAALPAVRTRNRGWLVRRSLVAADVVGLVAALVVAEQVVRDDPGAPDALRGLGEYLVFFGSLPAWVLLARQYGLYARDAEQPAYSTVDDFVRVVNMLTVGTWAFFVVTWVTGIAHPSIPKLIVFWAAALLLVAGGRAVARTVCRRSDVYVQNTIVVGAGRIGRLAAQKLRHHPEYGVRVIGFVDDGDLEHQSVLEEIPVLGGVERLPQLVREHQVERVI